MTIISRASSFSSSISLADDLSLSSVHETWKAFWGPTIKSSEIRYLIETTPRLSGRILSEILLKASSVRNRHINPRHTPRPAESPVIKSFLEQPSERLVYSVGLALHARLIKQALAQENASELIRQFDKDAIKYSLRLHEIAPHIAQAKLQDVMGSIIPAGLNATLRWALQFDENVSLRLLLHLPMPNGSEPEVAPEESLNSLVAGVLQRGVLA